ncbi:MAG: ankyrin repeat domain-containing protein, partial [Nitrosopumilus sp.]
MESLDPNELLRKSAKHGFLPGVNKALEDGADVHVTNDYALRFASYYGHYDVVALLLDNGADVHNVKDFALRFASEYGHYDIVALLLDNGADVHAQDDDALRWASYYGHDDVVELLKKWMNKPIKESIGDVLKPKSEEDIMSLIGDLYPSKLLYKSAEIGFLPGVKRAIEKGVNVHAYNDHAFRTASYYGHYDIVALLLDNGADVHAQDDEALRGASYYGYRDVVELLKKWMN